MIIAMLSGFHLPSMRFLRLTSVKLPQSHWNNNSNYENRQGGKQQNYKGKKDFDKKPWQNKD